MGPIAQLKRVLQNLEVLKNDMESGKFAYSFASYCAPLVTKDLEKIFKTSIDEYYTYPKKYYKRTKSFYKTYKITNSGTIITYTANSGLMPGSHRVSSEYIYDYMFAQGFHGGATKGKPDMFNRPFPGAMALRTPVPQFATPQVPAYSLWSKNHAGQTEAPETQINNNINAYENGGANTSGSTLQERVDSALVRVSRSYAIFR